MLLLLFNGGAAALDLSDPIITPPVPGTGVVTQFPATSGSWRLSLEIAEPPGSIWYDITQFYVGDRYQRGADDYKGKYRAAIATVQLQIDSNQAADLAVSPDILAPWGQDTTDLFGVDVELGEGLLMRLSMVREVDDVVADWLPLWTGRVELWGDASAARGQVRTHVVSVVDLLADMTNVPVTINFTIDTLEEYFTETLAQAGWPFGFDLYADAGAGAQPLAETAAAINRMDQIADPLGLVWRTLRNGRIVIHPAPWDTTHTTRYDNPLLDTYPDGLKFSYTPDFTDIEYIADDDQEPFGISRSTAGILNSFVVTMPDELFEDTIYAVDDPISTGKKGVRPFTTSWVINNPPAVDDLLADRAFSSSQALPLRTTIDHEGFWTALAIADHFDPVTVVHATSEDGLVVTGVGSIRNIVEERTVRDAGLLNWQSTVQIDLDSTESAEALLPVEDLALVSTESPLLGGPSTAEFSWTNPTQPSITPTEVQYRMLGRSLVWLPKSYPGVGADGLATFWLTPATHYTFQVRLIRRVDGLVTNYSVARSLAFTTPFLIYPVPTPGDDPGDTDVIGTPPDGECADFTIELQENDGSGWTTVDEFSGAELTDNGDGTFSLTDPIPNSFFNEGSMYRFRSTCDGVTWTNGTEFDPPDDWSDPCTDPPALSLPPWNDSDLLVYVPKICAPDIISEAVSGIEAVHGDALDEIVAFAGDPSQRALLAIADPEWSDAPSGIVAYGECPQVVGHTGNKTIGARVKVVDAAFCVFFECAAMRLTCTPDGGGWKAGANVFTAAGTGVCLSSHLDLNTEYAITATYNAATGALLLYVDGDPDGSTTFGAAYPTVSALPIWRVGAPPESYVTDCALWDKILDQTGPSVTINQGSGQADPALGGNIVFEAVFSEAVSGFATGDVTLSGTAPGTLTGTVVDSGDHIHFTVTVSGMSGGGTVIATIAAAKATAVSDSAPNVASTSSDNTVTYYLTPASVSGLVAWYDASDAATITATGAQVTQLNDKSGNGWHLTRDAGATGPDTGTRTKNGLNVLDFNGDNLHNASLSNNRAAGYDMYVVCVQDTTPASPFISVLVDFQGVTASGLRITSTAPEMVSTSGGVVVLTGSAYANGSWRQMTGAVAPGANGQVLRENAAAVAIGTPISPISATEKFWVGSEGSTFRPLDGAIAEILVFSPPLGSGDRSLIETYLAGKWAVP